MRINDKPVIVWDEECFPDFFSCGFITMRGKKIVFEVSARRDDRKQLFEFAKVKLKNYAVVGFYSMSYDYPLFHKAYQLRSLPVKTFLSKLKAFSNELTAPGRQWWQNSIKVQEQLFYNVDLFLMHHFDSSARSTSLKDIAFMMERKNLRDLPYFHNDPLLTDEKMDDVLSYQMDEDCEVTLEFLKASKKMFPLRERYSKELGIDMTNFNDTKMGKKYTEEIIKQKTGDEWFFWEGGEKKKTNRPMLKFGDAILPSIEFKHHPAFIEVLKFMRQFEANATKECFKDYPVSETGGLGQYLLKKKKQLKRKDKIFPERVENISVDFMGVPVVFGTGGIHASIHNAYSKPTVDESLKDIDVTGYYPKQIIEDDTYPAHVGSLFSKTYNDMYYTRVGIKHTKGKEEESAMLKLALNGTYGDMNQKHSVFFDPLALLRVTLNGQFRLCMLVEELAYHPEISKNFTLVQMNTDGMTFKHDKKHDHLVREVVTAWEKQTKMDMEYVEYSGMWVGDVNNYIARYADPISDLFGYKKDQGLKLKGRYEWDIKEKGMWQKNPSNRASTYAAVQYITQGTPVEETLYNYHDPYHFFLRIKVPKTNKLILNGVEQQHICRAYISLTGGELMKDMPPLPKAPDKWRRSAYPGTKGLKVKTCNRTNELDMSDVDMDYYIKAAQDLITPLQEKL